MDEITFKLAMGASGSGSPEGQFLASDSERSLVVPVGVFSICAVLVAGGMPGNAGNNPPAGAPQNGDGGSGGNLRWKNNISVTPGETLILRPGPSFPSISSTISRVIRASTGAIILSSDMPLGVDGVFGGDGGPGSSGQGGAGGGAGGYAGNGGAGQVSKTSTLMPGTGGAGAGGQRESSAERGRGGAVGLNGQGADGIAPSGDGSPTPGAPLFGFGGAGGLGTSFGRYGGNGAIRLIWGDNRAFPSLRTHDL